MKVKTLILTFFMMMSSPFLFGQHWVDPTLPGEDVMTVTVKVTLDGELQSGESYEVAVFNGDKLVEVGTFTNHGIPELEYHVGLTIPGGKGDKFYFKFFNGTNEYVSLTEIDYADEQGSHLNLFTIEFKSVASLNNVIYSSLQDAIDACTTGDNTITLLQNISDVVTVTEKTDVNVIIDGDDKEYTGQIKIHGNSTYENSTLTIKNVAFKTSVADHDFIWCDGSVNGDYSRYCQNVTVYNCSFTAEGAAVNTAVAARFRAAKNFTMTNCTATNLHSLMQTRGTDGITISGVTVENCKNGIAVGTSTNVAISGSTISATGYGVRADGEGAYTMTLTDNTISAELPVVVRNAKEVAYNLTIEGDNNNYTASNENGYQVVFTTGDDGTYVAPTTGQFVLTVPENFNVYPVYVAQVGDNKYTSVVTAINEAADGATVQLLPGTIDEYVYPWPESNHSKEKSITIVGAENYGTTLTAGMFLGYDDSQCREHNITVKGINFTGKGLTVACQQNVTIEDNKFNDIVEGRAIAVIGKNINSVVKNNVIDNVTTSQVGIELRNTLTATVEGNIISNTGHNSLQITSQVDATNSTITVKNNTMSNWGTAQNAQGELEGRAMRISNIVIANINGNVMSHTAAPEEFVKVTGSTTLDASENYWNGESPLTDGMFAGVEGDLVPVLESYYTDAEKTNLVILAPSVAMIGDVYYQSLQKAIDAATEGQVITVIDDIELESTVTVAAGKVVTLDLNGNVVSGVCNAGQAHLFMVQNTAELTVKDSSENQEGKISYARGTSGTGWAIDLEGELVLESGTIELTGESWSIGYVVDIRPNSWGTEYTEATTFTMNGGKLVSSFDAIRIASSSADGSQAGGVVHENVSANFVMNNGEIVSNRDAIFVQQSNEAYDILNLQVNDGRISGAQSLIRLYGPAATSVVNNVENPITLDLNGGTFDYTGSNLEDTRWLVPGVIMVAGGATFEEMLDYTGFEITGGTYDGDVSKYCAFGYTCQANGDGTYGIVKTEGFEIPNLDRLIAFRNAVNAGNTFKDQTVTVTADISMGDVENWTPIGTEATPFQGTFDGGNFTISNLKIDAPETSNVGLFGCIKTGATIKNLTIDNATVNAKSNVGAIVGNLHSSTMDNCHVTGLVQINGNYKVGGLVGTAYSSVRNSSLVADDYSYVKGTHATANLEGDNVGGITGYNGEGVYTYSNNTVKNVTISGTRKVGGILGFIFEDAKVEGSVVENVTIESTATSEYAQANAGKMSIGGIIGQYQTHGSNNGYVNTSVVKNVTFVKGEELDFQVGPLVGGTRNNEGFVPSATVTSAGNAVYMTTITGSNNLFLMHAVAKIEETNYYTLEEAIAAANNQTVTVLEDVELRNSLTIAVGQVVTLDLNGHVISGVSNAASSSSVITNNGNLTVQSSVEGGKVTSQANNPDLNGTPAYANNTITNCGVLTLVSGTIENSTEQGLACYPIDNNSTSRDAIVNIEGGLVTGRGAIRQFANSETNKNEVNVTGGKVEGTSYAIWVQNPSDGSGNSNTKDTKAALNISAGELGKILLEASAGFEIAISGGTISEVTFWQTDEENPERNASAFITGGTFGQDPTAYVAEGYVVKHNADGTYGVFLGVAKIDETGAIYGTLAEAVNAATAGNTITLLANITEDVTVNKNLTIDGKAEDATTNSTYTGKMTVNSSLNINIRNIDFDKGYIDELGGAHEYFTIVNCNFDGKDNSIAYAVTVRGGDKLTIENSTAKNYSYGMLYIPSAVANIAIKDVEVSNVTAAFNISYSGDGTFENVEVDNVTYGLHVQNYGSRTFTLKDCVMNNVNYPTYIQQKSTAEVTFEFNNVLGYKETINSGSNQAKYGKYVLTSTAAKLTNVPDDFNVTVSKDLADNGYVVEYNEGVYSVVAGNVLNSTTGKKYATIQDAIDAAQNGDVVVVLKDLTVTKDDAVKLGSYNTFFKVENKTVTIDLNGCDITGDVTGLGIAGKVGLVGLFSTNGEGHLTLEDSKGGAEVKIDNATETDPVYYLISSFDGAKGSITINGGSYSLNAAQDALIHSAGDECITINGGNFYLGNIGTSDKGNGHPWIVNVNGSNAGNITINGGTFNDDMNHQAWDMEVYIPETLALQNNGDGTWTVVESVAYVEEKGTLTGSAYHKVGYATLAEAFEATTIRNAKDNTVTVVKNIELEESITVNAEQEVVLDLNGKTLTGKDNNASGSFNLFVNRGTFEIKDSSAEGTGMITLEATTNRAWNASSSIVSNSAGTLTITSGTLEHLGGTDMAYGIDNNSTLGLTTLNVNGGKIASPYRAIRQFQNSLQDNVVIVNGGTISARAGIWMQQPSANDKAQLGTLTINDGIFECVSNAVVIDICGGAQSNVTINGGTFSNTNENANLLLIWPLIDMNSVHENCSATMNITGGNFTCAGEGNLIGILDGTDANGDVVLTGGTYSEDVNAYCAEGFAAVDNNNGTWTVMPTQEQSLLNGWNWYSTYLDITLNDLTTTLGDNGISIKNFNGITKENNGGFWMGTLNEINPSEMYMIQTTTECDLKLAADLLNPKEHQISLSANWNWIGYPSNQEVAINVALANIPEPKEGDIIKSLNNGYAEYAFGLWIGTLNTMVPGVGYKYNNKSGEAKTFYYNIEATRGAVEANVTAENNYWTPNATKYPHNMTMTAVVDGLTNGNYEVAAFVNGEVRGSARPVYVEALDAHIFFLTIHGEDVEEMSFRLYDIDTDTEYDLNDRINYSNDAHLGSISEPYVFSRGTTGIGEAALSEINIYPNPTTTGTEINLQNTCDTVEVFNALGVKVAEYHNVDSIDALETAGIYVIRITNDGNTQNCRLVVK